MKVTLVLEVELPEYSKEADNVLRCIDEWNTVTDFPFEEIDLALELSRSVIKIKRVDVEMPRPIEIDHIRGIMTPALSTQREVTIDCYVSAVTLK